MVFEEKKSFLFTTISPELIDTPSLGLRFGQQISKINKSKIPVLNLVDLLAKTQRYVFTFNQDFIKNELCTLWKKNKVFTKLN